MEIVCQHKKFGSIPFFIDEGDYLLIKPHKWLIKIVGGVPKYVYFNTYMPLKGRSKPTMLHNFLMGKIGVDHIDRNGLNNCRLNLREATQSQNAKNQTKKVNNTSGFKGVFYDKRCNKYEASITVNYKKISAGRFDSKVGAAKKYNELAVKHHGEFAALNIITPEDEKNDKILIPIRKKNVNNTSGYRGVYKQAPSSRMKNKWFAGITINGRMKNLGSFQTKEEAAMAYNTAAIKYFGEGCYINKIE